MTEAQAEKKQPRIWAVGGGKGGVGKSVITVSLAIAAARRQRRCILIDADLGGANLHTLLGMPPPSAKLADVFLRRAAGLEEVLLPTEIEHLQLVSGAGSLLDMANPHHAQKVKIIRQIFTLDADEVFIDLGAGSSFTVLDFFLAASEAIMVVTPQPTSVENAYHFIKAAYFRRLKQALGRVGATGLANRAMEEKVARGIRTPRDLLAEIGRANPAAALAVAGEMENFTPRILVNQVRRAEEAGLGTQMMEACRDFFGLEIGCLGTLRFDEKVLAAVQSRRPVLLAYPQSAFAVELDALAGRLFAHHGVGHPLPLHRAQGACHDR
ncbi:MAG: P-loop NTPase [Desulfuromonadales bacterium]